MKHPATPGDLPWLDVYLSLLLRWNRHINLIGGADLQDLMTRHVADSLQLVPLIPPGVERGIDLGSGAGLPGLILARTTRIHFELIDSDRRKAAFLREAARLTQSHVTIHATRIQSARVTPARLITARAVAPLPRLLELAAPLLAPDGICLFPKGSEHESELTDASTKWHMRVERFPSETAPGAVVLRISELRRVP
ncbi:MAG: 16S rRNA (guanine(527)-N(7))-methyltransferase RsmG [Acetobacteraceae bacterium]|nr:16S rRNA (guanine(527)-N(7))-methyltransferase RsmG [Acetobacteraceae bacterium]